VIQDFFLPGTLILALQSGENALFGTITNLKFEI